MMNQPPDGFGPGKERRKRGNEFWISEGSVELKVKILVQANCEASEHREMAATETRVREWFWWLILKEEVRAFAQWCIHCMISQIGERIPCPLATALHCLRPNEVVHADFLFMGESTEKDLQHMYCSYRMTLVATLGYIVAQVLIGTETLVQGGLKGTQSINVRMETTSKAMALCC